MLSDLKKTLPDGPGFLHADMTYTSGANSYFTLSNTGLEFSVRPKVLKASIAALKEKNPGTKVGSQSNPSRKGS
jgi:hypothetical protein